MGFHGFDAGDDESFDKMRNFFHVSQADLSVRQALHMCWVLLPEEKQSLDELERQFRRLVDRALNDLRDDDQAFGKS